MSATIGPAAIQRRPPSGSPTRPIARARTNPQQHLKLYRGALQADAYAGFQNLYEGGRIVEAACWAHARRKFYEIHIAHASPTTSEAIERIAALYAIEAEIRGSTPEIRKTIRQARARPLIDSMHTWLEATLAKLSRKSDTAAAIRYALSRWPALTRYIDDGQLEIDNNTAERALRVVALGRKNYLFAGSTQAENVPPPSTRCSAQPSSTGSIQRSISTTSSNESRTTRSAESRNCCRGMSHTQTVRSLLNVYPHNAMWIHNSHTHS
jgi:hypothetical protein